MPLFKVKWQHEIWHTTYVFAENEFEAQEKIVTGDFDENKDKIVGYEIQEHMSIDEVKDV